MTHLLSSLKRERERALAFQAIGLLAVSVELERDLNRHLRRIMDVIKTALPSRDIPQKCVEIGF